jgi:hypothetical protein
MTERSLITHCPAGRCAATSSAGPQEYTDD